METGVIQTTAAAQVDAETLRDKLPHYFPPEPAEGSSWPSLFQTAAGNSWTAALNAACSSSSRAGGTPGLLENQGPGPRPRQRPQPIGQWCGGPFQNLRRSRGRPTLGQQPRGVPHCSRSLGVDARIIRRRKSLASICHCSRNRSISLTPTIYPSLITEHPNLVPLQIYPTPLRISPWLWFR